MTTGDEEAAQDQYRMRRRPSIKHVAALAGVSISTVSHVFSRARPISKETSERVREAAETLGYIPNPSAAHLRGAGLGLIGLILRPRNAVHGTLGGTETFIRFSGAAAAAALATGRGLLILPDPTTSRRRFDMDGCIVVGPYEDDEVLRWLDSRGVPYVCADIDPKRPDDPWAVHVGYEPPMRKLLEAAGRNSGASATLIVGQEANHWTQMSIATATAWAQDEGRGLEVVRLFEGEGQSGAKHLAREVLNRHPAEHIIVGASSRFARGALDAALELGRRVPDEVRIACFTDSTLAREAPVTITALDLRMEEQARLSVDMIIERVAGKDAPSAPASITPTARLRESTHASPHA
ncbi:LacI family DNA-binding transcriptional regulator [Streptomyces samsunensis]|uniref:LacI family DNA-binding transcriptional regulator n=1 Tax=Streptomyces malaysiensis TaxID=92644 RepID=UPI0015830A07|nr:LacI family DNA-binding transcriptional regulator [Streptomyces samsunensis]NUH40162.1 LacI family DNA-binding transcriptional regulator [Streptomyces samsunensis]